MSKTEEGFLLIADITGYTMYLSQSELDHAQEILGALLELLLENTRPPLIVSRTAGDAVISYGLAGRFIQGQTFVEMIENTYVAYRKAIEQMVHNNNCQCRACRNIASLDLKFFVHYGEFALQHITDHDELVGSDVNLIHRLLKNHVTEQTGLQAYTLYTAAALQKLGIEDMRDVMTPHSETYDYLGEVQVWLQDMQSVWEKKRAEQRISILPDQVLAQESVDLDMPPELAWDYLIQPEFRKSLMGSDKQEVIQRAHGRIAPGSVYHCYHGKMVLPQVILEWQNIERIVTQDKMPFIPNATMLAEYHIEPIPTGTHMAVTFSKTRGTFPGRLICDLVFKLKMKEGPKLFAAFKQRIEEDWAEKREPNNG